MSPILKNLSTKKEHYSNVCTFEIASLVNVPGHYLRKCGMYNMAVYSGITFVSKIYICTKLHGLYLMSMTD